MRSRVFVMLGIGLLLMFAMWALEWQKQTADSEKLAPVRGCAEQDNCSGDTPVCLTHAEIPKGVCTSSCARTPECPELWCCKRLAGQTGPLRCLPPELCSREEQRPPTQPR